ncbi:MAG TPA: hypothetical protein VNW06_04100 [Cytophagaceae bacterium]|jgi:hypothetical protein|nr:hypothetical protein [Cytophagaceae bacterium]
MENIKLDRTSFEITTFIKADDDAIHGKDKTPDERLEYSMILNAVCYGFLNSEFPKMDKSIYTIVKRS